MSSVSNPHFDLPFRFGANGHIAVVQQGSLDDVRNGVQAVLRTQLGTRMFVPQFGIDDPTFQTIPIDLVALQDQILASEPRASIILTELPDLIQQFVDNITVEVGNE